MSIFSSQRQSRTILLGGKTQLAGTKKMGNGRKSDPEIRISRSTDTSGNHGWAKVFFVILATVSTIVHVAVSWTQRTPYMDEEFHIRQTQHYCRGNFLEWDNKITTLPGLYMLPSSMAMILGQYFPCTPFVLRSFNLIIEMCIFWVFYALVGAINPDMPEKRRAFMGFTLSLFPVNYFFTFLFYTDQLSTFLVFFMSYLMYKNQCVLSAVVGAYAVFTRQTNIIWVMWMAFVVTWNTLRPDLSAWNKTLVKKFQTNGGTYENGKIKGKKRHDKGIELSLINLENQLVFWSKCIVKIAPKVLPYVVIGIGFLAFVIINGGIVVGDRLAHQASINLPQLFYFSLFFATMLSPLIILSGPKRILAPVRNNWIGFVVLVALGLMIVALNTVTHPYLLADNRHYPFYIWKRVYEWYPIVRYLLVPCYIGVWLWICSSLKWDSVLMTGFLLCLAATLVPQKLMEFRYFIAPYIFIRLNINYTDWKYLVSECMLYTMINAFTLYQFVFKPFLMEGNSELRRFMW